MKPQYPFNLKQRVKASAKKLASVAALSALCASAFSQYTLSNRNTSVVIDPGTQAGMKSWVVDNVNHLKQQWWWYRVGNSPEKSVDTISAPSVTQPLPRQLVVTYANSQFSMELRYTLTGGSIGSGNATILEQAKIVNLTNQPLDFHLYEYNDLDLSNTPDDDLAGLVNSSTIEQKDGVYHFVESTVGGSTPIPNHFEITGLPGLLDRLNDSVGGNLNDNGAAFGPGNATFAFQWDFNIGANSSVTLSKEKDLAAPIGALGDYVWKDYNKDGVQDANEPGIPNVKLNLSVDFDGDGVADDSASTTTDAQGKYLFANLPAGQYTVSIDTTTLPAGVTQTYDLDGTLDHKTSVALVTGETNLNLDFGYYCPTAQLSGLAYCDKNGNKKKDDGETGISGVTITLGGAKSATAITDANGAYSFTALPAGSYTVSAPATAPDGSPLTTTSPLSVTLAETQNVTDLNFGYNCATGCLKGRLACNDCDCGPGGGKALAGVTVTLIDSNNKTRTAVTNANGEYTFTNLPNGTYQISVPSAANGYAILGSNKDCVTISSSNCVTKDFCYRGALIAGLVYCDVNGNGCVDFCDDLLENVTITLKDSSGKVIATTKTNCLGIYYFSDCIPAGCYTVVAPGSVNGKPIKTTNPRNVCVTAGEWAICELFGYNCAPPPKGKLTGKLFCDCNNNGVKDSGEEVLKNVTVTLKSSSGAILKDTTDSNGVYNFDNLAAGSYTVSVPSPANGLAIIGASSANVNINAGNTATQNFRYKGGTISGTLYYDSNRNCKKDSNDGGICGVTVVLKDDCGNVIATDVTDSNGNYSFGCCLEAGCYKVCAPSKVNNKPATTSTTLTVNLGAGQNVTGQNIGYQK